MSVNKVILLARLGKDPETRYLPNGDAVTNVSLATSEQWKSKDGEKQEKTEWHNLIFFRRLAEVAGEYLKKGSQVYVEGKIQTRKWQDKETGKDRYTTEIIVNEMQMLGGKNVNETNESQERVKKSEKNEHNPPFENYVGGLRIPAEKSSLDNFDDDIPL